MNRERQPHWSAGFVEHLRGVHFALMTLSVGLILIVLSSEPYNIGTAITQADEILYLRLNWNLSWLAQRGRAVETTGARNSDNSAINLEGTGQHEFACGLNDQRMYKCMVPANWIVLRRDLTVAPAFVTPESLPITVTAFQQWWEVLSGGVTLCVPASLKGGFVESQSHSNCEPSGARILVRDAANVKTTGVVKFHLRPCKLDGIGVPAQFESEPNAFDLAGKQAVIPVVKAQMTELDQTSFRDLFSDWKSGPFDDIFRDFSIATRGFKSEGVQHARDRLYEELKSSRASEQFEIFGLKIPAQQLAIWGILGLLCVELYFFVHLKQLGNKLHADDAGWDTPWLGMYATPLPRTIYFISVTIMPVVAIGILVVRRCVDPATISSSPLHWKFAQGGDRCSVLVVILFVLAFCGSGVLGWLSWVYRPRLNAPRRSH